MSKDRRIRTYSKKLIDPFNLKEEDVLLEDIAHSLSLQCRFTGHCQQHWSIAQHALLVANLVPTGFKFDAINHDDDEYCGNDITTQVKHHWSMWFYRRYEKKRQRVIANVFGLEFPIPPEVHKCDKQALKIEQFLFMGYPRPCNKFCCEVGIDYAKKLSELNMRQVEHSFIDNFYLYRMQERFE